MNFVKAIKIGGVTATQIPHITGIGSPNIDTVGELGVLYIDESNGKTYKCYGKHSNNKHYIWSPNEENVYNTFREEFPLPEDVQGKKPHEVIWDMYDELKTNYNGKSVEYSVDFTDKDGASQTFTNKAYVFSTGNYTPKTYEEDGVTKQEKGVFIHKYGNDPAVKKPKFLILTGIHGTERKTVYSTYKFIRDVLIGNNVPNAFREGVVISVMPIGTPDAFDKFSVHNQTSYDFDENRETIKIAGVNINRNFSYHWEDRYAPSEDDDTINVSCGKFASSEKETQAIEKWLQDNLDATLFIDYHNNGALNEQVVVMTMPDNETGFKNRSIALRGVNNVIPFWKNIMKYPDDVECQGYDFVVQEDGSVKPVGSIKNRKLIYSYCATPYGNGMAFAYAQGVLCIPSIAIETASYCGNHTEWIKDRKFNQPEAIAMGAEAIGNILIEFYNQSIASEVEKMSNFHVESGIYIQNETIIAKTPISIKLPKNTKAFEFFADGLTMEKLKAIGTSGTAEQKKGKYVASVGGMLFTQHSASAGSDPKGEKLMSPKSVCNHIQDMSSYGFGWAVNPGTTTLYNKESIEPFLDGATVEEDSITFYALGIAAGNYHWVAYCWD